MQLTCPLVSWKFMVRTPRKPRGRSIACMVMEQHRFKLWQLDCSKRTTVCWLCWQCADRHCTRLHVAPSIFQPRSHHSNPIEHRACPNWTCSCGRFWVSICTPVRAITCMDRGKESLRCVYTPRQLLIPPHSRCSQRQTAWALGLLCKFQTGLGPPDIDASKRGVVSA